MIKKEKNCLIFADGYTHRETAMSNVSDMEE